MSQTAQRRMQKWLRYNLTTAGKHPILQGPMFMDTGDQTAGAWTQSKRGVHTGQLEVVRTFSQHDVSAFTALTGDENPIHAHGPHAAVVPGMLLASLFPSLIGTHYPGSLYLNQTLKFRQQVVVSIVFKLNELSSE